MYLNSYTYKVGESTGNRVEIPGEDRSKYLSNGLGKYLDGWLYKLDVGERVAVLYAAGPAIHHSDNRKIGTEQDGTIVIKSQVGYSVYELLRKCKFDVEYVNINANTCASSMYCLYEADRLLKNGYTDVVVLALDMVDSTQELLFKQLGIELVCGDGVVGMHLSNRVSSIEIEETVWLWNRDSSPMAVSKEGYMKVLDKLKVDNVDLVKMHGSGTERNTQEELSAIREVLGDVRCIEYKNKIGHTQGASSGIEVCMMSEESDWNTAVVLASGLGGFYGGCRVRRVNGDIED